MNTTYIRFFQQYQDPVWGIQVIDWNKTPLVRVTRNGLKKAHFEWVGNTRATFDIESVRRTYPLVMYASTGLG